MKNMYRVGSFLKQKRSKLNLSMTDVYTQTGITSSRLSKLERGLLPDPSAEMLCLLSNLYQINILDILSLAGFSTSTSENTYLCHVEELNPEEIQNIQTTIDLLIQRRN